MKNLKVNNRIVTLFNGDISFQITLRPVTFARFNEIASLLGERDVCDVLANPSSLDIVNIAYCLLTQESRKCVANIKFLINDKNEEMDIASKLYYLVGETNFLEGHTNTSLLSNAINRLFIESIPTSDDKKKVKRRLRPHMMLKSFTILLLVLTVVIHIFISLKM